MVESNIEETSAQAQQQPSVQEALVGELKHQITSLEKQSEKLVKEKRELVSEAKKAKGQSNCAAIDLRTCNRKRRNEVLDYAADITRLTNSFNTFR